MTVQIRDAVFETNSSSSHSVTVSQEELADFNISKKTLRGGVITAQIVEHYGWAWKRYYSPGAKIAYLVTQVAGEYASDKPGVDVTRDLSRRNSKVASMLDLIRRRTGCSVQIIGASDASVDHDSIGVGVELFNDEDALLRLLFGKNSYVETGNDGSNPPVWIDTDQGGERYHEHRYIDGPVEGQRITFNMAGYGHVFLHPEGGEPIYAFVDDGDDMDAFLKCLDGIVIEQVDLWAAIPREVGKELAEEYAEDAVHDYLVDLVDVLPGMKLSEQLKVETAFDMTDQPRERWSGHSEATFTIKAAADPEMVGRMMDVLVRHSTMSGAYADN